MTSDAYVLFYRRRETTSTLTKLPSDIQSTEVNNRDETISSCYGGAANVELEKEKGETEETEKEVIYVEEYTEEVIDKNSTLLSLDNREYTDMDVVD